MSWYGAPRATHVPLDLIIAVLENAAHVHGADEVVVVAAASGYGHNTDRHYDDSDFIVEVMYSEADIRRVGYDGPYPERFRSGRATYGVNLAPTKWDDKVGLWMN